MTISHDDNDDDVSDDTDTEHTAHQVKVEELMKTNVGVSYTDSN